MPAFTSCGRTYDNPVQLALDVIGGRWKMPILWRLRDRTLRYAELRRSLNRHLDGRTVTDKMLASQLRALERDGLIAREVHAEVPPRVEYSITERGARVVPCIERCRRWATTRAAGTRTPELTPGQAEAAPYISRSSSSRSAAVMRGAEAG